MCWRGTGARGPADAACPPLASIQSTHPGRAAQGAHAARATFTGSSRGTRNIQAATPLSCDGANRTGRARRPRRRRRAGRTFSCSKCLQAVSRSFCSWPMRMSSECCSSSLAVSSRVSRSTCTARAHARGCLRYCKRGGLSPMTTPGFVTEPGERLWAMAGGDCLCAPLRSANGGVCVSGRVGWGGEGSGGSGELPRHHWRPSEIQAWGAPQSSRLRNSFSITCGSSEFRLPWCASLDGGVIVFSTFCF